MGYGFLTGALDASHPLAALDNSQVARFALAMNGFSMCVMNGSLVLYTLFRGIRDIRSGIVLVFGCAGFGFGAGLIELAGPVLTTVVP
ncbi:hypothetical protein MBEHAL_1137 [Halarchaeum acidiphilum MH1-52-1]|uniref:Uncharacterized protein n=1 Tax=Halarchaeum acidiphilum MH1-52-1 TaxID=1261545 RepID=U2YUG5_9EURY|nr:hypothetical protein MBEHAL_1137 [Halarchaeum acidiphilum MH1-52-1]